MIKENLMGQKFYRLTVVEEMSSKNQKSKIPQWKCLCDCGNYTVVDSGYKLKKGNTKSCGCLRSEISSKHLSKLGSSRRIYEPIIARARTVFKAKYNDGDLTFEQFYQLSQQNCFYCNKEPSNIKQTTSTDRCDEFNKSKYIYNGVDRVNNDLPHNTDNCVPCCKECNMSKRNMTLEDFYNMITNIAKNKNKIIPNYEKLFNENKINLDYFERIKGKLYASYEDIKLDFKLFSFILTLNCFYCDRSPSNKTKCKNGDIVSCNGLDRIDQNKTHTLDNIVSCCKYCNWSKTKRSKDEYISWAEKVYNNLFKAFNKI